MDEPKLTSRQAYLAMFSFLEAYYARGKSDEIGSILGSMTLLEDGFPADPAYLKDWEAAVSQALDGENNAALHIKE
jgi:hypothetical protein